MLQNICFGLHSMCKGAQAKCFDRHTNIKDAEFICFGVKELIGTNKRLKDTLLFNILRQSVIYREVDTILSGCH